jgi:hypothetical protein
MMVNETLCRTRFVVVMMRRNNNHCPFGVRRPFSLSLTHEKESVRTRDHYC